MKYPITALRLKEALNNKNMKAQELADKTGINKASISQYINGSHSPSNISAGKIAAVLDVSALWLMGFDVSSKDTQTEKKEGKELLDKLTANQILIEKIQNDDTLTSEEKALKILDASSSFKDLVQSYLTGNNNITEEMRRTDNIYSRTSKAIELYTKYENAIPEIQDAVERLLKSSQ